MVESCGEIQLGKKTKINVGFEECEMEMETLFVCFGALDKLVRLRVRN